MFTKYFNVKGSETKKVKVKTYYSLGGVNYFNYSQEARGYYVSVSLVDRVVKNGYATESFSMMDGYKLLLREVKRASKKAEQISDEIAMDCARPIIERVCQEHSIEIEK